jgi:VWFA-related protein
MHRRAFLFLALTICLIAFIVGLSTAGIFAQSSTGTKSSHKDFGSSLKRLKWDPKKNAAVETKSKNNKEEDADEDVVRVQTSLVVSDLLVVDQQGEGVLGLTQGDFVVTEDGKLQQVEVFSIGQSGVVPRSIVLIIDSSLNQAGFVDTSVQAAKSLVDALRPKDRMAIVTDQIELLSDFTQDKQKLKEKLDSLTRRPRSINNISSTDRDPRRRSGHYSALLATLNELFTKSDQLPLIIFQANGNEASLLRDSIVSYWAPPPDYLSGDEKKKAMETYRRQMENQQSQLREFSLNDVFAAVTKSRATIYAIIPGPRLIGLERADQISRTKVWTHKFRLGRASAISKDGSTAQQSKSEDTPNWMWDWAADSIIKEQDALLSLAKLSGGWADFLEDPKEATQIFSRILSDMNQRYIIGYYPSNKDFDGKLRRVNIAVSNHPEYLVLGRKSYYAPSGQPE